MRPPKPSLLTDAPKPRETPKLAGPGHAPAKPASAPSPAAAPAAADGARPRAKPIAFRVRATTAKSVALVGAFIVRGGRLEMKKDADGIWEAEVYLHPGQYRYFFAVDKKKVLDPENPRSERGSSLLTVP
jgi:1,4-alpha-glucan branching enzyme